MKISDEIRNDFLYNDDVGEVACRQLLCIADRIDSEMMELPRDRDGALIRPGDMVYLENGNNAKVDRITFTCDKTYVICWTGDKNTTYLPCDISHERPDSWKRIAVELEDWGWNVDSSVNGCGEIFGCATEFADRIRDLAEKEGE